MSQGAAQAPHAERAEDLYETPIEALRALYTAERLPEVIWEPCAGKGAISEPLRRAGHRVYASDLIAYEGAAGLIQAPVDFFAETSPPPGCRCIVTNPPYKSANAFIRHGLALHQTVIVLWRLMALEGTTRNDLIDGHLRKVWLGRERLPMMHRDGWEGPKLDKGGLPFGWYVFEPTLRPPNSPVELFRMSWRG